MKRKNLLLTLFFFVTVAALSLNGQNVKKLSDIPIRDPYIMPDKQRGYYYMYKSASVNTSGSVTGGVEAYKSKDLENWEGPVPVFSVPADNWITGPVWAPEVHAYNGKYFLFATLNSTIEWKKEQKGWPKYLFRGTQIFVSDDPEGPFLPFEKTPHTPYEWRICHRNSGVDNRESCRAVATTRQTAIHAKRRPWHDIPHL